MRKSALSTLAIASVVCVACCTSRATAQQSASPAPAASQSIQLAPVVVVHGKHSAEIDLAIDIDSTGKVVRSSLVSGDPKFFQPASKAISTFLYREHAGVTGAKAHVSFLASKDLHNPTPDYPANARYAHVSGTVELAGELELDGHVTGILVVSGPPMLTQSAIDAFRKWVFLPGRPSASRVLAFFEYDLN